MPILKTMSLFYKLTFSFYFQLPSILNKILFSFGYISLIGPPMISNFKSSILNNSDKMNKVPKSMLLIYETSMRAGFFLLIAGSIEWLLGEQLFELYRIDSVLMILILAGLLHIFIYYLCFISKLIKYQFVNYIIYRLGRNLSYAVVPSLAVSMCVLFNQLFEQIDLYSGNTVQFSFITVYIDTSIIGILEAFIMQGKPLSLRSI